jgi:hypothetical protein
LPHLQRRDLIQACRGYRLPRSTVVGERLFGETREKKPMRLLDTKTVGDGLAFLTYEVVRED